MPRVTFESTADSEQSGGQSERPGESNSVWKNSAVAGAIVTGVFTVGAALIGKPACSTDPPDSELANTVNGEEFLKLAKLYAEATAKNESLLRDLDDATEVIVKRAQAGDPRAQEAREALARGKTRPARKLFEESVQVGQSANKASAETYRRIGALAFLDDGPRALEAYREATRLDPTHVDGWNQLGHLLNREGKLDEAIKAYEMVAKVGLSVQSKAASLNNRGLIYRKQGRLNEALECHKESLAIETQLKDDQGIAVSLFNLGLIYAAKKEGAHAQLYLSQSLKRFQEMGLPDDDPRLITVRRALADLAG